METSLCLTCSNAIPQLCRWINCGQKDNDMIFSKPVGKMNTVAIIGCARYNKGRLPAVKLDTEQSKKIAALIIVTAIKDLSLLCHKVLKIRELCNKGELFATIKKDKEKDKMYLYPLKNSDDKKLTYFFRENNHWLAELMDYCDISVLPGDVKKQLKEVMRYEKYCSRCVRIYEGMASREIKDRVL